MQALAWQLLRNLERKGIGTHEIEFDSLKRSWQREVKKGYDKDLKEFGRSLVHRRDQEYVKGLLRLRAEQAKQDWEQCREKYRTEKKELQKTSQSLKKENLMRREHRKMVDYYSKMHREGTERHRRKMEHLEKVYADRKQKEQREEEQRKKEDDQWIQMVAQGTGASVLNTDRQVPIYGNIEFDNEETAALRLPPKFCLYDKVEKETGRYERALCSTKVRWGRRETGSPEEQEQEAEAKESEQETTPEEQIIQDITENSSREVYDRGSKVLDFRKLKVYDMKDNPRVQLPPPRPPKEERVLEAKEFMWNETLERFISSNCDEKGNQRCRNTTREEQKGMKKIRERQKDGSIVISTTDKSGKTSASSKKKLQSTRRPPCSRRPTCNLERCSSSQA